MCSCLSERGHAVGTLAESDISAIIDQGDVESRNKNMYTSKRTTVEHTHIHFRSQLGSSRGRDNAKKTPVQDSKHLVSNTSKHSEKICTRLYFFCFAVLCFKGLFEGYDLFFLGQL